MQIRTRILPGGARKPAVIAAAVSAVTLLAGCGAFDTSEQQSGEDYPTKPVTLTAPAEPGSGWDTAARALATAMDKEGLGDSAMPVQNRTGATGCVWLNQMISNHEGDDSNIAVTSTPIMSTHLRGDCDPEYTDVTMIASIMVENYIVVVPKDSPFQDAEDLLTAVKKDPESVPIAASGDDQLPFALLAQEAGADPQKINFIQYEGGGEEINAMYNGDVEAAVAGVSEFRGQLESGDLRGMTVLRDKPLDPPLDDIPTTVSLGYDVTLGNWRGIYGPPGMSDSAVTYWQDKLREILDSDTYQDLAKRNQWQELYLTGDKLDAYLEKANADIKKGLIATGAID